MKIGFIDVELLNELCSKKMDYLVEEMKRAINLYVDNNNNWSEYVQFSEDNEDNYYIYSPDYLQFEELNTKYTLLIRHLHLAFSITVEYSHVFRRFTEDEQSVISSIAERLYSPVPF